MRTLLATLLADQVKPNHLPDTKWLLQYLEAGCPAGDPIFLSMGETWADVPSFLSSALCKVPEYSHGYQLSMYGLPQFRQALLSFAIDTQHLPAAAEPGVEFDLAVTWTGTRSVMFDFGRLLRRQFASCERPVAVSTFPGWDYEGALEPSGFEMRFIGLRAEQGFSVSAGELRAELEKIAQESRGRFKLLVINAQHNPTGVNWTRETVSAAISFALENDIALLVDDAVYGVHIPSVTPTSAVDLLLQQIMQIPDRNQRPQWLAVRSLGKQFNCNGWGLGYMMGPPATIDQLVNYFRVQYQYNYAGHLQHAMASWISSPESVELTTARNAEIAANAVTMGRLLKDELKVPPENLYPFECGLFYIFPAPPAYASKNAGAKEFLQDCFMRTGVLFSSCSGGPRAGADTYSLPWIRFFLGARRNTLEDAVKRMIEAGFCWEMEVAK
jgi:aspartate/methionine/tyrosine aminotransferase